MMLLRAALILLSLSSLSQSVDWSGWGGSIFNNRWASQNAIVSSSNINTITQHCHLTYPIGVSATPTIGGDIVYYPTWNGLFVALNYVTCVVQWEINVTTIVHDYAPLTKVQAEATNPISRTSPQIDDDVLYFGTQTHALIVAVSLSSGQTLGVIQINPHPVAVLTMSPTFFNSILFVGASSLEEGAANSVSGYQCCSFAGNVVALTFDHSSGKFSVVWNVTMLPEPIGVGGWSGAAVWGSQPSIDTAGGQVFFATGNIYEAPQSVQACINSTTNETSCLPSNVWQESVLAVDIASGRVNWVRQLSPLDAWTVACGIPGVSKRNPALCPETPGPDADFGMAPTFVPRNSSAESTVVVGQKNGNLYSLSANTGKLIWSTITSPDGTSGGLSWGIAADDSQVYFTAINSLNLAWQLQPSNQTVNNSAYGAASLVDGTLVWETSTPQDQSAYPPPSVVGDLVLVGRTGVATVAGAAAGTRGGLVALAKSTGEVIVDIDLDVLFQGGIAIQDNYILFGTGYVRFQGIGSFYVMQV
ncbi:Quino protein alcohol dehydrogenase-like protein, partial [Glonium stellatum]